MATRLRLPPLLDVVVVDDPGEMDWFERDPAITREISAAGGWLHRLIHSRIYRTPDRRLRTAPGLQRPGGRRARRSSKRSSNSG